MSFTRHWQFQCCLLVSGIICFFRVFSSVAFQKINMNGPLHFCCLVFLFQVTLHKYYISSRRSKRTYRSRVRRPSQILFLNVDQNQHTRAVNSGTFVSRKDQIFRMVCSDFYFRLNRLSKKQKNLSREQ